MAGAGLRVTVGDLVDAAAQPVLAGAVVIIAGVRPVADEDAAVGTVGDVDGAVPRILHVEDVGLGSARREKAGAAARERFDVHPMPEQIQQIDVVAVRRRPVVALIDHHADDRVAVHPRTGLPRTHASAPAFLRRVVAPAALRRWRFGRAAGLTAIRRAAATSAAATSRRDDRAGGRAAGKAVIGDVIDQLVRLQIGFGGAADEFRPGIAYQRWPTIVESKKCSPYLSQSWPHGLTVPELSASNTFVLGWKRKIDP